MRFTTAVIIAVLVNIGGTAYGQQPTPPQGCTSYPLGLDCSTPSPSPSPSPSPTPDASATPTPVPTVEATVGVQETRPPGASPVPSPLPGDEVRSEVVRGTNNPSQPVNNGREQLPATGLAGVETLLLILLAVWGLGFTLRWWSEKRGYRG